MYVMGTNVVEELLAGVGRHEPKLETS